MKIKKFIIKILIILVLMLLLAVLYNRKLTDENIVKTNVLEEVFEDIEKDNFAYLDLYTLYGNHLNIEGHILKDTNTDDKIQCFKILITDNKENVLEYDLKYTEDSEKYSFKLSESINEGIDLEKLPISKSFVFIKAIYNSNEETIEKKYTIKNVSVYSQNEYYTMTQNNTNKKIDVYFNIYENLDYMQIKISNQKLPQDVYDIVIDPGHGGKDPGAMYDGKAEADLTLEYSILLKQKLEEIGYKVKLTRIKDEYVESYGRNSRATTSYETKAKLVLSIHLNSTANSNPQGGVEVYAPNNANLEFAKSFANNIVAFTGTGYSPNNVSKVYNGVYVRTYTEAEIKEAIEYAHELNYKPYETLSTQTPYLFMIRETGGIMTHAYIDGRNTYLDDNPYYNSNQAAEAYLLELGFINSKNDLNNLLKNKEKYIDAIVSSIKIHYNN